MAAWEVPTGSEGGKVESRNRKRVFWGLLLALAPGYPLTYYASLFTLGYLLLVIWPVYAGLLGLFVGYVQTRVMPVRSSPRAWMMWTALLAGMGQVIAIALMIATGPGNMVESAVWMVAVQILFVAAGQAALSRR